MAKSTDNQKSQFSQIEEELVELWQKEKTFRKSVDQREGRERFNFNDGPPFANGLPHFGHSLVTGIKDSILRYKTMQGYYVPRRNGWDCHGLPVEFAIEKDFGVSGKKQILELGIEKFNAACRDSIFTYKADWEDFLTRYGRWSDYENYYATVDTDYTESVWWTLAQIHQKGMLYKGFKSLPYCPRCATPLSNFELNEGYKDDVLDPSVFVKFDLPGHKAKKSLLAWTTTPWTLPANAALAVAADADYVEVELLDDGDSWQKGESLILAKNRLSVLDLKKAEYKVVNTVKGRKLVDELKPRYSPLYDLQEGKFSDEQAANTYHVFVDDSVSLEDGTGILHVAPRYGETDLALGQKQNLPLIESVDSSGHLIHGPEAALGKFFKGADNPIIADLTRQGKIFAAESNFKHTYPFCWRCDTPLMYYATDTWFVEVTKVKDQMIKTAEQINWVPANIKAGRWGKWLEGARDWAISRNRYWGAPMPIWVNTKDDTDYIVVESIAQLKQLAGPDIKVDDLHRPFIDEISFEKNGNTYKRIEEVLDCWFESGSMPVAQWHYPFENKEKAEELLTADFVTEAIDQTRLWFYVQHVISTILFNKPAFKQVIVSGFVMAADGQKLSKRLKNYPPVDDVFAHEGADALRLYLLSRTQGTETADYMRFDRAGVTDIQRNVLGTLFNSFKFFKTYSELDKWEAKSLDRPASDSVLDQWILARLDETIIATTNSAEAFKIAHAIEPIVMLIDDLSNWYIRRSRKRFWKSENDTDKDQAYATLYHCLMRISQLLAPWAPYLPDHIWRELRAGDMVESVHLSDWPGLSKVEDPSVNESFDSAQDKPDSTSHKLLEDMAYVRGAINIGLAKRAEAKIKVRQPLAKVTVFDAVIQDGNQSAFEQIIKDELNVKEIEVKRNGDDPGGDNTKKWADPGYKHQQGGQVEILLDTEVTPELKSEGIARDLIRFVQNGRKNAGFNVEDRIQLKITSEDSEITEAAKTHKGMIFKETLATSELTGEASHNETVKLEGQEIEISVSKTK